MRFVLISLCILLFTNNNLFAHPDSHKNFHNVTWTETAANHIRYCRQMGYEYLGIKDNTATPYAGTNTAGLNYFFTDPKNRSTQMFGYDTTIDITEASGYPQDQKDFYNQYMVWKSNDTFPNNLATGWFYGTSSVYELLWDFQQQAVVDMVVEGIINMAKTYQKPDFKFAGWMDDEPNLNGYFYTWDATNTVNVVRAIGYWTGTSSGLLHGTITHEHASYADGKAAFYKTLRARCIQEFGQVKWHVEPSNVYNGWVSQIAARSDAVDLLPDFISQESASTQFIDDTNIYSTQLPITYSTIGISQPDAKDEVSNRTYAAKAGINGAWYNWFGFYDRAFTTLANLAPRYKLVRVVPNWDNLNGLGTSTRSWDGTVYESQKNNQPWSGISPYIIYSRHWKRPDELFVCALGTDSPALGTATWSKKYYVKNVYATNAYFEEAGDGSSDWNVDNKSNKAWIKEGILSGSSTDRGKVYIFELGTRTANFIGNNKRVTIGNKQKNSSY